MLREQLVGAADEAVEFRSHIPLREILSYALPADVVRGRELHIRAAVRYDEAVTIAHPGIERETSAAEFLLQKEHELARFRRGDLARGIVAHGLVLKVFLVAEGDQVHAEGDVVLFHVYADGERLQRGSARVALGGVIAQRAEIRDVAAGLIAVGDGLYKTNFARLCEGVHARFVGDFQRSAPAERGDGIIPHAVTEDKCVFHFSPLGIW